MSSDRSSRGRSAVPRGFSRYYVLELLRKEPHTGKQIIDCASEQSQGIWKPSPGLVYPLLGRLLDEGLIEEIEGGRYQMTEKGISTAEDIDKINDTIKKQIDVLTRLGSAGHFVAMDVIERMISMGVVLSANVKNMKQRETARYKSFLESELKALNEKSAENGEDAPPEKDSTVGDGEDTPPEKDNTAGGREVRVE